MAIPKLLEIMRNSLSGEDWNYNKKLKLSNNNETDKTEIIAGNAEFYKSNDYGFGFDIQEYTTNDGDDILSLYGMNSGNVVIQNVGTPVEDNDAVNKAYVDNNGGTFTAIYGTTTYAEIVKAFNQGKTIYCYHSSYTSTIYMLATRPTDSNVLYFYDLKISNYATTYCRYCQINSDDTWSTGLTSNGQVYNKIYSNSSTTIASQTGYYRPIRVSTAEPTSSDGNMGDIWVQYDS